MFAKRIIPCLDVKDGKVVKGINFVNLKDVGDPVECAIEYDRQGADEIVFLDITATTEDRETMVDVVKKTAQNVFVPLTVGGGIRSSEDFRKLLLAGADKVGINSAAVKDPSIISDAASKFGRQCVVAAIDGKYVGKENGVPKYNVFVNGGGLDTGLDVVMWAKKTEQLGAGEILLTSMDADGTKAGFDIEMLNSVSNAVGIPVVASGGGGKLDDFIKVFKETSVDAALAASVFHYGELTVGEVKAKMREEGIPVRL